MLEESQNPQEQQQSEAQETETQTTEQGGPTDDTAAKLRAELEATKRWNALLEQQMREQNARISELSRPQQVIPEPTPEEDARTLFADPRRLVREELQAAIAPLQEFVQSFRRETELDKLITRFKTNPAYAAVLNDPAVENTVRQVMTQAEPTDVNMQSAILQVLGAQRLGLLGTTSTPKTNGGDTVPRNTTTVIPAHVRPTPPQAPTGETKPQYPPLTEHEERMRRERGMSVEDWHKWVNTSASDVAISKIGRS